MMCTHYVPVMIIGSNTHKHTNSYGQTSVNLLMFCQIIQKLNYSFEIQQQEVNTFEHDCTYIV